jgi:hypothetical protein
MAEVKALRLPNHGGARAMILEWQIEWQRLYVMALLETNPMKVLNWVSSAEVAILSRIEELCIATDAQEEWTAMEDALRGLAVLKREILRYQKAIQSEKLGVDNLQASAR